MEAKYIQKGESLDYLNTTTEKIKAGSIISLVTRIGVAGCDIAPGETGSVEVVSVFEMPKSGKTAIPMGTAVFYDGAGITTEKERTAEGEGSTKTANIPAGYAAASATADATSVRVKLMG